MEIQAVEHASNKPLTYSNYLELTALLDLQRPRSTPVEHDEMLFIVIHQIYELWFKQLLHETDHLKVQFAADATAGAAHTLTRVLRILKTLVAQIDILETMTPLEFLSFRARLESASGFESQQFRQFEFTLGLKRSSALERFEQGSAERAALQTRYEQPSIWDDFLRYLTRQGYPVPDPLADPANDAKLEEVLIGVYRTDPANAALCERLVDLDEGLQEWRYRHVKMVQRTIGTRQGTGGSSGVDYLRSTLFKPVFGPLWDIRGRL
ncbi:MAG: tryptophan 2,3-dioxygenase [Gammaproteobacteria bacterium]